MDERGEVARHGTRVKLGGELIDAELGEKASIKG